MECWSCSAAAIALTALQREAMVAKQDDGLQVIGTSAATRSEFDATVSDGN